MMPPQTPDAAAKTFASLAAQTKIALQASFLSPKDRTQMVDQARRFDDMTRKCLGHYTEQERHRVRPH